MSTKTKKLTDFFKEEVRSFSIYSCERTIPSGVDGLKTSQRKVVFGMLKKFPTEEVKVSIAAASIMAESCYHHGTLEGVVVNMAQSFVGSNNLPLLEGIGQFGSRIAPDAAATRYIFTKLSTVFNKLVSQDDAPILQHLVDDDVKVEPEYYLPIIPLVLINGADGMGTGYSSHILGYNPKDVRNRCIDILNGKKIKDQLLPWYNGFKGTITKSGEQVTIRGGLEIVNSTTVKITELPVGQFTTRYRDVLNKLEANNIIKTYDDNSSEKRTEFIVKVTREFTQGNTEEQMMGIFKLISRDTENITVWNEKHKIQRFNSADALVEWFVDFRLKKYDVRKDSMLSIMGDKVADMTERASFIRTYLKNSSKWSKMTTDDVISELTTLGYSNPESLLGIRISKLTGTAIEELETMIEKTRNEINVLMNTTTKELYMADLVNLKL